MKFIYNRIFLEHDTGVHPENKERIECLGSLPETEIVDGEEYLELFHTHEYIQQVREACKNRRHMDLDTVVSMKSYEAAVKAVGATVLASQSNDFALVRPPGHHAHPAFASGFCLFNNVAVAAQRLVKEGRRVFILDFDGHLGDGTEEFFYNTDRVLYWSLHQSPAFPGGGSVDEFGEGRGEGYTINVPLPPGSGDDLYLKALEKFMPVAEEFKPDFVAVSAGFDAHQSDMLLDLRLSVNAYYNIGRILSSKFKSIFAALEGGYNVKVLPKCVHNFMDGVNGKEMKYREQATVSEERVVEKFEADARRLERNLSMFWSL